MKYMISFALPRFCDQSLDRSRKERFYPGAEPWIAKLDTVVHELYHIDPELAGIRRIEREDGTYSANCHGQQFFEQVAEHGARPISTRDPIPAVYDFLRHDFAALERATAASSARASATFPSFPQRYIERLARAAAVRVGRAKASKVEPLRVAAAADALHRGRSAHPPVHEGRRRAGSIRKGQFRAA